MNRLVRREKWLPRRRSAPVGKSGSLTGARLLPLQPSELREGGGGREAGRVVGSGSKLRLRYRQLGGDGARIHRLHIERAFSKNGEMLRVHFGEPAFDEDA